MRVLDMTSFWAGPSCTHVLAQLGAEVIHVESTARPDGTRLIAGVPVTEDQWWERSPIFSGLNTNKKSVTLDIRNQRGVELLHELVKTCDVIVENYTPRVLDQIGLDFDTVHRLRPDAIMMRMPGFGLDGPWRDKPAFAYVIEDASGITWLTGHPDQNPVEPYAVGDPNAGVHGLNALMLALAHRRRTGEGVRIEAAMVDAALNVAAEQVIEHSAYGNLLQREGNRGPTAAPQNLYRTSELDEFGRPDDWVAIAVATDEQWANLVAAARRPGLGDRRAGERRRTATTPRWDRRAPGPMVRCANGRRDRRNPLGRGRARGQGDAATPGRRLTATGASRLLRAGGPPGQPDRQAQHASDAHLDGAAALPPARPRRFSDNTTARCSPGSGSATTRSPSSRSRGSSAPPRRVRGIRTTKTG